MESAPDRYVRNLASCCSGALPACTPLVDTITSRTIRLEPQKLRTKASTGIPYVARPHISSRCCTSASVEDVIGSRYSSQAPSSQSRDELPQLVLRGPEQPATLSEGYAPELPKNARNFAEASDDVISVEEAAFADGAVEEIKHRRQEAQARAKERYTARKQRRNTGALGRQRSAAQQKGPVQVGDEVDLVCVSLAFGGQV